MSGPGNSTDHTIIPIEVAATFTIAFDKGHSQIYGAMPDVAVKVLETDNKMHDCLYIPNEFKVGGGKK